MDPNDQTGQTPGMPQDGNGGQPTTPPTPEPMPGQTPEPAGMPGPSEPTPGPVSEAPSGGMEVPPPPPVAGDQNGSVPNTGTENPQ